MAERLRAQRPGRSPSGIGSAILLVFLAFTSDATGAEAGAPRLTAYQYFVQVGAFTAANNATALVEQLQEKNISRVIIEEARDPGDTMARVLVGPFDTHEDALLASQRLIDMKYQPFLIGRPLYSVGTAAAVAQAPGGGAVQPQAGAANPAPAAQAAAAAPVAQAPKPVGKSPAFEVRGRPDVQAIPEIGGVLTPKNSLVLEPSIEYSNSQVNRFTFQGIEIISSILLGVFEVEDIDRDVYASSLTGRWGITSRLEGELKLTYISRNDDFSITIPQADTGGEPTTRSNSLKGDGMGDVEAALHYQFNDGSGGWPFLVGNLRYKFSNGDGPFDVERGENGLETELATGSGYDAMETSITALYPSDPAMFFGNVGYLLTFDESVGRTFGDQTVEEFRPGDSIRFNVGMAYAINQRSSFTLGYKQDFIDKAEVDINGVTLDSSDLVLGTLFLGFGMRTSAQGNLNLSLEVGVTDDAPDMRVSVRLPYQWAFQ